MNKYKLTAGNDKTKTLITLLQAVDNGDQEKERYHKDSWRWVIEMRQEKDVKDGEKGEREVNTKKKIFQVYTCCSRYDERQNTT